MFNSNLSKFNAAVKKVDDLLGGIANGDLKFVEKVKATKELITKRTAATQVVFDEVIKFYTDNSDELSKKQNIAKILQENEEKDVEFRKALGDLVK